MIKNGKIWYKNCTFAVENTLCVVQFRQFLLNNNTPLMPLSNAHLGGLFIFKYPL